MSEAGDPAQALLLAYLLLDFCSFFFFLCLFDTFNSENPLLYLYNIYLYLIVKFLNSDQFTIS